MLYNKIVNVERLTQEIRFSEITVALDSVVSSGTNTEITFKATISAAELIVLDSLVANHSGHPLPTDLPTKDSDGDQIARIKNSSTGYTFQARGIEIETSVLSSTVNNKVDGTDWGDSSIKFYDAANNELTTQSQCNSSCVETVLDWEPAYDYDLIGGYIVAEEEHIEDIKLFCIAVPDIPVAQGGNKYLISGLNIKYQLKKDRVRIDGRTPKHMTYDATLHTNKLRKIFTHASGKKMKLQVVWEHYFA